jgi:hypothetical protein
MLKTFLRFSQAVRSGRVKSDQFSSTCDSRAPTTPVTSAMSAAFTKISPSNPLRRARNLASATPAKNPITSITPYP